MVQEKRYRIGKTMITCTSPCNAKRSIEIWAKSGVNGYVCIANVRSTSFSNKHEDYRQIMNNSLMTTPDGMPLVWMARLWGLKNVERTIGPELFVSMLEDTTSGLRHFLLGDTNETLSAIKGAFPNANIVGVLSPPFCEVDEFDYGSIATIVNESGADVVWVSLRSPKQDYFSSRLLPFLKKGICVNVGAAFRYSIGQVKDPPTLFKKLGLTGFFWRKIDAAKIWWYMCKFATLIIWGADILYSRSIRGESYK